MVNPISNFYKTRGAGELLVEKINEAFISLRKGHVIIPLIDDEAQKLLQEQFVSNGSTLTPFVVSNNNFYYQQNFRKEVEIVDWVYNKVFQKDESCIKYAKTDKFKSLIDLLFPNVGEVDWQKIGSVNCFVNQFSILSGGPGTGKTTTVAKFLSLLLSYNLNLNKIALVAQTAKASTRLKESLNNQLASLKKLNIDQRIIDILEEVIPSTIHRLLKTKPGSLGAQFMYSSINYLPHDVVLIDEASMIDLNFMHKLFLAIKPSAKVVLMGDKNQLSPVGAGSVFSDITQAMYENIFPESMHFLCDLGLPEKHIRNGEFNVMVQLTKTYRFDGHSQIFDVSQRVLDQTFKISNCSEYQKDVVSKKGKVFFLSQQEKLNEALKEQIRFFRNYINHENIVNGLAEINTVRILCATKGGDFGVFEMNKKVEMVLEKDGLIKTGNEFYHNQLIMITKNNYQSGLFNGDVGLVREDNNGTFIHCDYSIYQSSFYCWK